MKITKRNKKKKRTKPLSIVGCRSSQRASQALRHSYSLCIQSKIWEMHSVSVKPTKLWLSRGPTITNAFIIPSSTKKYQFKTMQRIRGIISRKCKKGTSLFADFAKKVPNNLQRRCVYNKSYT